MIIRLATFLWRRLFRSSVDAEGDTSPLKSLSLAGDGDEIYAIEDVEIAFDVRLDYAGAKNWHTVGDVYRALLEALGANGLDTSETWEKFASAIAQETDVNPARISRETLLLG